MMFVVFCVAFDIFATIKSLSAREWLDGSFIFCKQTEENVCLAQQHVHRR